MFLVILNILLFNIVNEQLFEALFYGSIIVIFILIIFLYYFYSNSANLNAFIRDLQQKFERRTFENDSQSKQILNYDIKIAQFQKQAEESNRKIQDLGVIFSDQNVILEREVRKQTQKISDANEKLQKVVDELDMFIYKTSHDIRGPLARLIGLSQLALLDVHDAVALEYLSKLGFEANHLNSILKRLSTIYEINNAELFLESFNVKDTIYNTISELKFNKEIIIETFVQPLMEINTDKKLFVFILKNLLENAIRFRKQNIGHKPLVTIHFNINQSNYLLSVYDNGIGINELDSQIIFDMFTRAAGIHKTTGLGLYMCKLAAEKLNGKISLVINKNDMTEFRVEFPFQ